MDEVGTILGPQVGEREPRQEVLLVGFAEFQTGTQIGHRVDQLIADEFFAAEFGDESPRDRRLSSSPASRNTVSRKNRTRVSGIVA